MNKTLPLLSLILFSSCSQLPLSAPSKERLLELKDQSISSQELKPHEALALKYSSGLRFKKNDQNQKACQIFQELSANERFPLKNLSQLRVIQTCSLNREEKIQSFKSFDSNQNSKLTDEEFLRYATTWLDSHSGPVELAANYSFRLHEYEGNQEQKIQAILKAINHTHNEQTRSIYQEKLMELAPRFIKNPAPEDLITVARDLERARQFKKARAYYREVLNSDLIDLENKLYALKRIGLTYKVQRSRELYLKKLKEIGDIIQDLNPINAVEVKLKAKSYLENQITLARAIWTANEREKAQNILIDVLESVSQTSAAEMAHIYYILGAMELEAKKPKEALDYFKQGLEYPTPDSDIRQYLSWSWGHNLFLMQNYEKAIEAMQFSLERAQDDPTFKAKLLFWQGMSFLKLDRPNLAQERFEAATELAPHSYYAIVAQHKLGKPFQPVQERKSVPKIDRVFEWLVLLNEKNAASAYIKDLSERRDLTLKKKVSAYSQAELYKEAIFAYARGSEQLDEEEKSDFIPLIFPTAFLETYQKYAQRFGIPYELALSITRQESAFNKDARSWADAFGLMQLIPEKATSLSKELGLKFEKFSELYDPELNIQLGSYLLSKLLKRYDREFPFFIAAYNAGSGPIRNWKKSRYQGKTLEFIEMIPYAETQKYVKLILRNMVIYRQLTGQKEFTLEDIGVIVQ